MLKKYSESLVKISASLLAIVAGLLFGLIILFISNPTNALSGFSMIMTGAISEGVAGIAYILYLATPIIMTGLSVGFAFKTGLFNIGVTGQLTMGAFIAVYVAIKASFVPDFMLTTVAVAAALIVGALWGMIPGMLKAYANVNEVIVYVAIKASFVPDFMLTTVAVAAALIVGALWGMIPGMLKAYANVNEVISSILLNYIAMYLVNMLIPAVGIYDQLKNRTEAVPPAANFPLLIPDTTLNAGIFVSVLFTIIVYIIIEKTVFGFELKACGLNRYASKYAGINEKRSIILSMMIAGALAGVGGALIFLSGTGRHISVLDTLIPEGFTGISVALLGQSNPIGIFFAGIFIAYITRGGTGLQLLGYTREIIDVITASIIYFGAFSLLFSSVIKLLQKKRANTLDRGEG